VGESGWRLLASAGRLSFANFCRVQSGFDLGDFRGSGGLSSPGRGRDQVTETMKILQ
jgi:hypothetical protein